MTYPLSELSRIRTRVERHLKAWKIKKDEYLVKVLTARLSEIDSAIAILSEHQSPRVESLAKELDDNYFG